MALTEAEKIRIRTIEEMLNDLQIAIKNVASKLEVRQSLLLRQKEIEDLKLRVTDLESQVKTLQSKIG